MYLVYTLDTAFVAESSSQGVLYTGTLGSHLTVTGGSAYRVHDS